MLATLVTKAQSIAEQFTFVVKIVLKMMARKIIKCLRQSINISKRVLIVIIFHCGKQKDCRMKVLSLRQHLILLLIQP